MTTTAKKIYSTDTDRLNAAIAEAEGRAKERCMTAADCAGRLAMAFDRTIIIGRLVDRPTAFGAKAHRKSRSGVRFQILRSTFEDGREVRHYHDVAAFGRLAATVYDNLGAGDLCLIEGRLARRDLTHGPAAGYPPILADNVVFIAKRR